MIQLILTQIFNFNILPSVPVGCFVITVTGNKMRRRRSIVLVTAIASSELVSLKFLIDLTKRSVL